MVDSPISEPVLVRDTLLIKNIVRQIDKNIRNYQEKNVKTVPQNSALNNMTELWVALSCFEEDIINAKKQYPPKNSEYHSDYGSEDDDEEYSADHHEISQEEIMHFHDINSETHKEAAEVQNVQLKSNFFINKPPSIRHELSVDLKKDLQKYKILKKEQLYFEKKNELKNKNITVNSGQYKPRL